MEKGELETHLPTFAGEAVMVQFVALVAATDESPVGVEAALFAGGSHLALVHI